MQIKDLLKGIEILNVNNSEILLSEVEDISFDNRNLKDNSVFFAYKGTSFDTHNVIDEIIKSGKIKCVVCEKPLEDFPYIIVNDGRKAFSIACANFFGTNDADLLKFAITGTNGKTTVSYIISAILRGAGHKIVRIGTTEYFAVDETYVAENTTPGAYDFHKVVNKGLQKGATALVAEVSSHALNQDRIYGFKFNIGIYTNLSGDHLDYHKNMEDYFAAKKKLFTENYTDLSIINIDCPYGKILKDELKNCIRFSIKEKADFYVEKYNYDVEGIKAEIISAEEKYLIESDLIGEHNLSNILCAIAACEKAGINKSDIENGIKNLKNVPGRLEKFKIKNKYFVVDYAHTDDALGNVLKALNKIKLNKIITVFGCGGDRDKTKRPRMAKVAEKYSDIVIVTSDNPRTENPNQIIDDIAKGFDNKGRVYFEVDRRKAIALSDKLSNSGDIVLIAGKGHEDYQIIGKTKIHFDDREEVKALLRIA